MREGLETKGDTYLFMRSVLLYPDYFAFECVFFPSPPVFFQGENLYILSADHQMCGGGGLALYS